MRNYTDSELWCSSTYILQMTTPSQREIKPIWTISNTYILQMCKHTSLSQHGINTARTMSRYHLRRSKNVGQCEINTVRTMSGTNRLQTSKHTHVAQSAWDQHSKDNVKVPSTNKQKREINMVRTMSGTNRLWTSKHTHVAQSAWDQTSKENVRHIQTANAQTQETQSALVLPRLGLKVASRSSRAEMESAEAEITARDFWWLSHGWVVA